MFMFMKGSSPTTSYAKVLDTTDWQVETVNNAVLHNYLKKGVKIEPYRRDVFIQWAKKMSKVYLDRILDTYTCTDYIEFIGTTGGDALTFRFYETGTVGEK